MPRVRKGAARHRKHKKILKAARGYHGAASRRYRLAKQAIFRAGVFATRDRRTRKRNFRALWITRITAACRQRGILYSRFIHALSEAGIALNRKMLSEIAIADPPAFDRIVEVAGTGRPAEAAQPEPAEPVEAAPASEPPAQAAPEAPEERPPRKAAKKAVKKTARKAPKKPEAEEKPAEAPKPKAKKKAAKKAAKKRPEEAEKAKEAKEAKKAKKAKKAEKAEKAEKPEKAQEAEKADKAREGGEAGADA
jgi:large subunit ribosomal protein L20